MVLALCDTHVGMATQNDPIAHCCFASRQWMWAREVMDFGSESPRWALRCTRRCMRIANAWLSTYTLASHSWPRLGMTDADVALSLWSTLTRASCVAADIGPRHPHPQPSASTRPARPHRLRPHAHAQRSAQYVRWWAGRGVASRRGGVRL